MTPAVEPGGPCGSNNVTLCHRLRHAANTLRHFHRRCWQRRTCHCCCPTWSHRPAPSAAPCHLGLRPTRLAIMLHGGLRHTLPRRRRQYHMPPLALFRHRPSAPPQACSALPMHSPRGRLASCCRGAPGAWPAFPPPPPACSRRRRWTRCTTPPAMPTCCRTCAAGR